MTESEWTESEWQQQLMDYLFGGMDEEQKSRFEQYVSARPERKRELEELDHTRNMLHAGPPVKTPARLLMISAGPEEKTGSTGRRKMAGAFAAGLAAAAAVLLLAIPGLLSGTFQAGLTAGGFYVSMGSSAVSTPAPSEGEMSLQEVHQLLDQVREENLVLAGSLAGELAARQNEQFEEFMSVMLDIYEQQRQDDLMMVENGLNQLEQVTLDRFLERDEVLWGLMTAFREAPVRN